MDFHAMKRKELQALCKKHKIPANLTNREMADLLALHFQVGSGATDDKVSKQGPSCLKNLEEVAPSSNDEKLAIKEAKKVRFSPQNETFEFEMTDPRAVRLAGRRRRRKSVIVANNENQSSDPENPVAKKSTRSRKLTQNVEEKQVLVSESGAEQSVSGESEEIPVRTTRSRGRKAANTDVSEKSKPGAEDLAVEKRQTKGKEVMDGNMENGKEEVPERGHEATAATRRSTRRAAKVIDDDFSKISKRPGRNARSNRQVVENVDSGYDESGKGVEEVANESDKTASFQSEAPRKSARVASKQEPIAPGYSKIKKDEDVVDRRSRKRPREPNDQVAAGEMKSTDLDLKQDSGKAPLRRSRRTTIVAKSVAVTSETQSEETGKNHRPNTSDEIVAGKAELGADRHEKRSTRTAITRGKTVPGGTTEKAPVRQSRRATMINKSVAVISETQHEETDKNHRGNTSAEIVEDRVELGADRHEKRSTRTATTRQGKKVPAETGVTTQKAVGEAKRRKRRRDPIPAEDAIATEISHIVEEQPPRRSISNGSTSGVPMIVEDTKKNEDGSVPSIVEMEASLSRPALADEHLPEDSNEPAFGSGETVSKQKKGAKKKSSVRKTKGSTGVSSKSGTSKVDVARIPVAESKQLPTVLEFPSVEVNPSIEGNSQILIQNEMLGVTENNGATQSEGQVVDGDVYKMEKDSTEATEHRFSNHFESYTDEKLSGSCNQLEVPSMIEDPVYPSSATLADDVAEHCRNAVSEELNTHKPLSALQSHVAGENTQSSDLVTSSENVETSSEFSVREQTEVLAYEDKVNKEMSLIDTFAAAADCPPAEIGNMMGTGECHEGHSSKEHSSCLRAEMIDVMAEGVTIIHNEQGMAKFDEAQKSGICQQVEDKSEMVSTDDGARKFDHLDRGLAHVLSENDHETGNSTVEAKLLGMNESLFHNEPTDVMQPEDTDNETSTTPETSAANDFGDNRYSASRPTLADGMGSARYESSVSLDQEMSVKTSAKMEVVGTAYINKTPVQEDVDPEEILVLAGNAVTNIQVIENEASTGKFAQSVSREKVEAAEESGEPVWPRSGKKLDHMAESSQSNEKEGRAASFEGFDKLSAPSSEQLFSKDTEANGVVNNETNEISKTAAVEAEANRFHPSDNEEKTPIVGRSSESSGYKSSSKNDLPEEIFSQSSNPINGSSRLNNNESNNVNTMVENDGSAEYRARKPIDSEKETIEETVSPFEAFQLCTESAIERKLTCVLKSREEECVEEKPDEPPSFNSGPEQEEIANVTENSNVKLDDTAQVEEPDKDHGSKLELSATKDGEAESVNTGLVKVEDISADQNAIAEASDDAAQAEEHDKDHGSSLEKSFNVDGEPEPVDDDLLEVDEIDADQDAIGETSENLNVKLHEQSVIKDEEAELDDIELVDVNKIGAEEDPTAKASENWNVELHDPSHVEDPDKEHGSNLEHSVIKDVEDERVDVELLRVHHIDADQDAFAETNENSNAKLYDVAQIEDPDKDNGSNLDQSVIKNIDTEPAEDKIIRVNGTDAERDAIAEASDNSDVELHDAADVEEPDEEQSVIKDVEAEPVDDDFVQVNNTDAHQDAIAEASENSDVELHDAAQFVELDKYHGSKLEQLVDIELAKANEINGDEAAGSSLNLLDVEGSGPIDNDSEAGCFGEVFKLRHTVPDPTIPVVRCVESNSSASVSDGQCPGFVDFTAKGLNPSTSEKSPESATRTNLCKVEAQEMQRLDNLSLDVVDPLNNEAANNDTEMELSDVFWQGKEAEEGGQVETGAEKSLEEIRYTDRAGCSTQKIATPVILEGEQTGGGIDNHSKDLSLKLPELLCDPEEREDAGLSVLFQSDCWDHTTTYEGHDVVEGVGNEAEYSNRSFEGEEEQLGGQVDEEGQTALAVPYECPVSNESILNGRNEDTAHKHDAAEATSAAIEDEKIPASPQIALFCRNVSVMPEAVEKVPERATGSKLCEDEMQETEQLDNIILGVEEELNNEASKDETEMELSDVEVNSSVLVGQPSDNFWEGKESEESGLHEAQPEKSSEEIRYMDLVRHSAGKITVSVALKGEDTNGVEHFSAEEFASKLPELDGDIEETEDAGFSVPFQSDCYNHTITDEGYDAVEAGEDEGEDNTRSLNGEKEQLVGRVDGEGHTAYECPVFNEPGVGERNEDNASTREGEGGTCIFSSWEKTLFLEDHVWGHDIGAADNISAEHSSHAIEEVPQPEESDMRYCFDMDIIEENLFSAQHVETTVGYEHVANHEQHITEENAQLKGNDPLDMEVDVSDAKDQKYDHQGMEEDDSAAADPEYDPQEMEEDAREAAGSFDEGEHCMGKETGEWKYNHSAPFGQATADADNLMELSYDFQEMDRSRISMEEDANERVQEQYYPTGVEESYNNLAPSDAYPSMSDQPAGLMAADVKDIPLEDDKASEAKMKTLQENPKPELEGSCVGQNQNRFILIHGTPRKMLNKHDMKENKHGSKMEQMLNVTAVKPLVKRKALQELQKN